MEKKEDDGAHKKHIISDIYEPPKYDWWTRLLLKRKPEETPKDPPPAPDKEVSLKGSEKISLGLKLSTFHRTLKKEESPSQVEKLVRRHLESQKRKHDEMNKVRKAEAAIKRDMERNVHILVAVLKKSMDLSFVKYGRVVKGRHVALGIFESQKPMGSLVALLVRKGSRILWAGRGQRNLPNFKVVKHSCDLKNTDELFFYRSALIKAFESCFETGSL